MASQREPTGDRAVPIRRGTSEGLAPQCRADDAPVEYEWCGADMVRMHAVWRCPACRFKTDCCGW